MENHKEHNHSEMTNQNEEHSHKHDHSKMDQNNSSHQHKGSDKHNEHK